MKRVTASAIWMLGSVAWAAQPGTLTTLRAVQSLTNEQASHALPVSFEGTVTYFRSYEQVLFLQDGNASIYVQTPSPALSFSPGDRVLVQGKTHNSFRPEVFADNVKLVRHGSVPEPIPATFDQLIRGDKDCTFVKVHGKVRTADIMVSNVSPVRSITMQMLTNGGIIHISLDSEDSSALESLLDAEVEVTGVVSGRFDGKNQLTGIDLNVSSLTGIRVLKRANLSPWSLPVSSMSDIMSSYHEVSGTRRILVHGVITYYQPGEMVVLQDGAKTLRIMTRTYKPLRIGDLADATGFPDLSDGFLTLVNAEIQDSSEQIPVTPVPTDWQDLSTSSHIFDLVAVEGVVVAQVRESVQDEYVIETGGHVFSAVYQHPDSISRLELPAMKMIPVGSRVRVVGICIPTTEDAFSGPVPFNVLMRSFDDVSVVAHPRWLSVRHLAYLVCVLLLVMFIFGVRVWFIERGVRRQNASMAYVERRRSRILEGINGAQPLADVIEQITELVSFKLKGSLCWCQIAGGAQLGNCPAKLGGFRIVEEPIPSRNGPPLGYVFAAFDSRTPPTPIEAEGLQMAAALARLAIETRRMYTDLLRRSEFDLLTDTHNRFSLDKQMELLINQARQEASLFGLIYIDLDHFKQVNDLYGHQTGDSYLQEVAVRIKAQLRPNDMLARLGGDEFAVLVPTVHSRTEVEEISQRLDRCLRQPFHLDDARIDGSASMGLALYPDDGISKDTLLKAADSAMYIAKNANRTGVREYDASRW